MWCLHDINFKVNYSNLKDCPVSGRDLKWTLQVKKQKKKKKKACPSAMIYFFPVTSKPLFVY